MQIESPGSCNQTSQGCAAMGAALSSTLQPHQLFNAIYCVSPECWYNSTQNRLGTYMRGTAESSVNFSPKRQKKEIICRNVKTAGKDSDCRRCNLSFYVLFTSP